MNPPNEIIVTLGVIPANSLFEIEKNLVYLREIIN